MGDDGSTSLPGTGTLREVLLRRFEEQKVISEQFVPQDLTCPVCRSRFQAIQPKSTVVRPRRGEEYNRFLYTEYDGPNPNHYSVAVCPTCLYAAYTRDFEDVAAKQALLNDMPARRERLGEFKFAGLRDHATVQASYELALRCYEHHRRSRYGLQAAVLLQMAWLAQETGRLDEVEAYLAQAYANYQRAYAQEKATSVEGEIRLTYILGLLAVQVGTPDEAVRWFEETTRHPEIGKHPEMGRRARERWHELRHAGQVV